MIIFDASYLVVLLHPNPAPAKDRDNKPVTQFQERVAYLAATMDASNDTIGIPTPAMAEVLVRSGSARAKYVSILGDRLKFQIIPFDSRAAIEAADLIAAVKSNKEKWDTWAKVKFDIQIIAIAKAESAKLIYSDDKDIENYAKRFKIRVMRICDLPLPPPPPDETIPSGPAPGGTQGQLPLAPVDPRTPTAPNPEDKGDEDQYKTPIRKIRLGD
jgi:predicted nucleic acid-binding protein